MDFKVVLFLVEGVSDKLALEKIFQKIYSNGRSLTFKFLNGDITSDPESDPDNIVARVERIVTDFKQEYKLEDNDFFSIAQIFDVDGAYIPDELIIEEKDKHYWYTLNNIISNDRRTVIERNQRKRANMDKLTSQKSILGISYECFFMSCNLDHVLYDEQNMNDDEKTIYAMEFAKAFRDKEMKFPEFMDKVASKGNGKSISESWRFLKCDKHSLERNSNLNLYFRLHPIL